MKTFNLLTDDEYQFDDHTTPEYAVCYAYAMDNNMASWFFAKIQDDRFDLVLKRFPKLIYGQLTVGCDNWVAKL